MIEPFQLVWGFMIFAMLLALLVLIEIRRGDKRREHEVMFDTEAFDEKVKNFDFSVKEVHTLEKLVRASKFDNKDAVLNSAALFETAVLQFYDVRNVYAIREETLASVAKLREKLNFTAKNPLAKIKSSRQFSVGDRVDVILESGVKLKHSEILWKNEKEWAVLYDNSFGVADSFVGKRIRIRWTRPEDAVYSAWLEVKSATPQEFVLEHTCSLEKQQLRRWVREIVDFPVTATFADGSTCIGRLYDLSAGGILIGLPVECSGGSQLHIQFELPGFGNQDVEIEILRSLGRKNPQYPDFYSMTASFTGAFGWIQECVLQYIFESRKQKK
ncbi:MAG: PilZ domain-containing protein [Fibrobacter sp.]|uniref:PilZ domain-containing protein n=1 Tax=uncultured Fibrobacter sp. TaxID=261512 RepID=UPI001562F0D4|nr:PilZ domain-containing protein [uncultured Fibrobacter sp.]MBQ1823756.1 PilZ domain-containing protein [Fibrobacter sp.]MBR6318455.1 PilZ domain-containing protein [Fibrobacter sp.]